MPVGEHGARIGEALGHPPRERRLDLGARELLGRDGQLGPHLGLLRLGHLQGHLGREAVLVGDASRLQQVLRALALGQGVGAVGLGQGQRGPHPVVGQAIVGVVEHGEGLARGRPGALVASAPSGGGPGARPPPAPARAGAGFR